MFAATNTWMGDRLGIKRVCEEREEGKGSSKFIS